MWDLRVANPFGRLSIRSLFLYAAATVAVSLLLSFFFGPSAHAADASWNGKALTYEGKQFTGPTTLPQGQNSGIPNDSIIFIASEASATTSSEQKVRLIYFPPGTDTTKATSAKYVEYLFTPPNTYKSQANQKDITIDAATYNKEASECAIQKVGWIVCPISDFLAWSVDKIFDVVSTFVEVRPLGLNQDEGLYRVWSTMRSFANIAFIIAFLIVIYSQVTATGISNYGLKKILPRLIIAAILVNVSYYICAVAIDLSNISGYALYELMDNLRDEVFKMPGSTTHQAFSWQNLVGFALSAGAVGAIALPSALAATGGSALSAVAALVPILIGLLLIALLVLIVLAARQAIIVVLVVIAPLAFVAFLLPSTEKWFKKWQELLTTMLIFFPIFSLIFGGAQVAGAIIISNAQSIIMLIFGMAVQIAPLAVVPLILKLSGSLLGKIAGMVNDPKRGLMDRAKNLAGEHQEYHKQRGIGGNVRKFNYLRRMARRMETGSQLRKQGTERYKQGFESHAAKHMATSRKGQKVEVELRLAKIKTEEWQNRLNEAVTALKANKSAPLTQLRSEGAADQWRITQFKDRMVDKMPRTTSYEEFTKDAMKRAVTASQDARVIAQATHIAEHEEQQNYAKAIAANESLRMRAGGIGGQHGADSALASAVAAQREAYGKYVSEAHQVVKHYNLSSEQRQALALGTDVKGVDSNGVERIFKASDTFAREAVIETQVSTGTVEQAEQIVQLSGSDLAQFRTTISDEVAKAGLGGKTIYLGGATINEIAKGTIKSKDHLVGIIQDNIAKGKISSDKLVGLDKDAVKSILNAAIQAKQGNIGFMQEDTSKIGPALAGLKAAALKSLKDDRLNARITENVKPMLEQLRDLDL